MMHSDSPADSNHSVSKSLPGITPYSTTYRLTIPRDRRDSKGPTPKAARTLKTRAGYTLLELMVTIAIVLLLVTLAGTGLKQSRSKARQVACENNFRQLILTWNLYSADHQERLVSNVHLDLTSGWVRGSVRGTGATNTLHLVDPEGALFAPYLPVWDVYRCPADESSEVIQGIEHPRVRSVSMNQAMGFESYAIWLPSKALAHPGQQYYLTYRLSTDIQEPSERFVFVDESEVTINDPAFAVEMPQQNRSPRWIDVPTTRHRQSGVLAFADGHVETHRWKDPRTSTDHFDKSAEHNEDWLWLTTRTSAE